MSLVTQISTLATRLGTEFKTVYGRIGNLSSLTTTAKTDLVAAVNEVAAAVGDAGATIDDATTSTLSVWSSNKTTAAIASSVSGLVNSAPTALDTLGELATALAADEAGASALTTAVGNRVRFDAAQTLTAPQKTQAQSNLGLGSAATHASTEFETAGAAAAVTATSISAVPTARQVIAGTGLTGGGALSADRTLAVTYGTSSASAAVGNDARLSDARTPLTHTHAEADVTGLTTDLAAKLVKASNLSDLGSASTARSNLSVYSQAEIGDPTTDFAAVFTAALV